MVKEPKVGMRVFVSNPSCCYAGNVSQVGTITADAAWANSYKLTLDHPAVGFETEILDWYVCPNCITELSEAMK